jgi:hypothetical protein
MMSCCLQFVALISAVDLTPLRPSECFGDIFISGQSKMSFIILLFCNK